jgi:hypothetical protein
LPIVYVMQGEEETDTLNQIVNQLIFQLTLFLNGFRIANLFALDSSSGLNNKNDAKSSLTQYRLKYMYYLRK